MATQRNRTMNRKKSRRHHNSQNQQLQQQLQYRSKKTKTAVVTASVPELLELAAQSMTTLDLETAYLLYQKAMAVLRKKQPSTKEQEMDSDDSISSTVYITLIHVLEKMGEIQVSMGDPDQAKDHFVQALHIMEEVEEQSQAKTEQDWNILESHASICLYIGQLSIGTEALDVYLRAVSSLEQCLRMVETADFVISDDTVMHDAHDETIMVQQSRNESVLSCSAQQRKQQMKQQLQQKLCGAYCNLADLYLTDLCDEESAESNCEQYLENALSLKDDKDEEPFLDALQTMANLRLSQAPERRHEAVSFILRAYEKQRIGSEALAALVGLNDGGTKLLDTNHNDTHDDMLEGMDQNKEKEARELVEVEAANNLPEFEFRCQTAKLMLECADLLTEQRKTHNQTVMPTHEEVQCRDGAISVLGSLLAQNDEVVEIWYLTGCAFASKTPPLIDTALYYLERAKEMLLEIRKSLDEELKVGDPTERSKLQQELELNGEQMKDVIAKIVEMKQLEQKDATGDFTIGED